MSVETKLNYLKGTKDAIREAILEKGGEVEEDTPFRDFAEAIAAISGGNLSGVEFGEFTNIIDMSKDDVTFDFELNGAPQIIFVVCSTEDPGSENSKSRDYMFVRNALATGSLTSLIGNFTIGNQYKYARNIIRGGYVKNVTSDSFDLQPNNGLMAKKYYWFALYVDLPE